MSSYETIADVQPVRIETFRRMCKRHKHGEQAADAPALYNDCFVNIAPRKPTR